MKNEKILTEYFKKHLINRYIILNMKYYLYATRLPPRCPNHFITFEYAILRDNIVIKRSICLLCGQFEDIFGKITRSVGKTVDDMIDWTYFM